MPRQLDAAPAAQLQPTGDLGRPSNRAGTRDEPSAALARNLFRASLEREAREKARVIAGSTSDAGLATRESVRTQSVERVSVVDGADRMTYSETRGWQGWRQPLAAQEALRDARRRGAEDGDYAGKGARIVQTFEGEQAQQAAIPRVGGPASPTRYALGRSSLLANNPGRAAQPQNSARSQQPQTVRETPATRARAR